jgi:citrate synthase
VAKIASAWVDTDEAIDLLGVSRATLYAYVSRGRVRSEAVPGGNRRSRYSRDDLERLVARSRERRNPAKAAEQALHWGLPILESKITLIADERMYYRGRDASELARSSSLADVAALLWIGAADGGGAFAPVKPTAAPRGARPDGSFVAAAQAALALAAAADPLAFDLRPRAVVQTGWRILWQLARVAAGGKSFGTKAGAGAKASAGTSIDATLAAAWGVPRSVDLVRAALILSADHELNVSTFTARCVASAGGSPYGVVIAGLAALEGTRHGGATARIEASWDALRRARGVRAALADKLRRGEAIEGFGHRLYAQGDPRAAVLLALLPSSKAAAFAREFAASAQDVLGEAPTVDFALVAVARSLGLPNGAALTLFAIGRTLGWVAHALEQYADAAIIRPRAKYVGEAPRVLSTTPV